jgi:hypothetical protein
MKLTKNQTKCLKNFYQNHVWYHLLGEGWDHHYDGRVAESLVNRGLLRKVYSEHHPQYVGYLITNRGLEMARGLFGDLMDSSWHKKTFKNIVDMGFSTDRLRENHVDNFSDELPWRQVSKANHNLFHYRDVILYTLWVRRN